jgi:hypothetical protein
MESNQHNMPGIMAKEPGKPPRMMMPEEIVQLIQSQQQEIQDLKTKISDLEETVVVLQNKLLKKKTDEPKSTPDIMISI